MIMAPIRWDSLLFVTVSRFISEALVSHTNKCFFVQRIPPLCNQRRPLKPRSFSIKKFCPILLVMTLSEICIPAFPFAFRKSICECLMSFCTIFPIPLTASPHLILFPPLLRTDRDIKKTQGYYMEISPFFT